MKVSLTCRKVVCDLVPGAEKSSEKKCYSALFDSGVVRLVDGSTGSLYSLALNAITEDTFEIGKEYEVEVTEK